MKEKFCTPSPPQKNRTPNFQLPKPIPCHYIEGSIAVSTSKINSISAVGRLVTRQLQLVLNLSPLHYL